jgi:hypothetical protein
MTKPSLINGFISNTASLIKSGEIVPLRYSCNLPLIPSISAALSVLAFYCSGVAALFTSPISSSMAFNSADALIKSACKF